MSGFRHFRQLDEHFDTFIKTSIRPNEPVVCYEKVTVRLLEDRVVLMMSTYVALHVPVSGTVKFYC